MVDGALRGGGGGMMRPPGAEESKGQQSEYSK
jgi:hypothetical protein